MKPGEAKKLARDVIREPYIENKDHEPKTDEPGPGESEPGPSQFDAMHIKRANNGFTVETHKNGVTMQDGEIHVFRTMNEVANHILGRKTKA